MTLPFSLLERIGSSSISHVLTAEEFILLAKEASFAPCLIIAGFREGDHEAQIEIVIRFRHEIRDRKT